MSKYPVALTLYDNMNSKAVFLLVLIGIFCLQTATVSVANLLRLYKERDNNRSTVVSILAVTGVFVTQNGDGVHTIHKPVIPANVIGNVNANGNSVVVNFMGHGRTMSYGRNCLNAIKVNDK
ncbi:hypothetical protein KUTeg_002663 [Tegillarca granosa]|uniref:Uncharacterized protein n=1 Tax=Tegillarca granosa TaxID=220873 RepID=A0ABQ9FWG6_TEGGR|nr:hypothetical protein KUTeg_002663 [Tegillarca granosa]